MKLTLQDRLIISGAVAFFVLVLYIIGVGLSGIILVQGLLLVRIYVVGIAVTLVSFLATMVCFFT